MREAFLLEPNVIFLNHGSFGATPKVVFAVYQSWQRRLEAQPVRFLARELKGHLAAAKEELATYVGAAATDLVFIPNATFGVNAVARALPLGPGDEVLASDQEYGACQALWLQLAARRGFVYRSLPLPLGASPEAQLAALWQGVTERTKVIFLSHITSPTAQTLPIAAICERARAAGILTVIDGAHAPGQLPLQLAASAVDMYIGNCHKWLLSPKGAGFLYAHPSVQQRIEPLLYGWGQVREAGSSGSSFLDAFEWLGTSDPAAYLSVPAAITFQRVHDWQARQRECHALLGEALAALAQVTGLKAPYADASGYCQLAVAPLPPVDPQHFQQRLYLEHAIEVPVTLHGGRPYLRLSVQVYNSAAELQVLVCAVAALLGRARVSGLTRPQCRLR
jgi:isopenicillin-N epimerase